MAGGIASQGQVVKNVGIVPLCLAIFPAHRAGNGRTVAGDNVVCSIGKRRVILPVIFRLVGVNIQRPFFDGIACLGSSGKVAGSLDRHLAGRVRVCRVGRVLQRVIRSLRQSFRRPRAVYIGYGWLWLLRRTVINLICGRGEVIRRQFKWLNDKVQRPASAVVPLSVERNNRGGCGSVLILIVIVGKIRIRDKGLRIIGHRLNGRRLHLAVIGDCIRRACQNQRLIPNVLGGDDKCPLIGGGRRNPGAVYPFYGQFCTSSCIPVVAESIAQYGIALPLCLGNPFDFYLHIGSGRLDVTGRIGLVLDCDGRVGGIHRNRCDCYVTAGQRLGLIVLPFLDVYLHRCFVSQLIIGGLDRYLGLPGRIGWGYVAFLRAAHICLPAGDVIRACAETIKAFKGGGERFSVCHGTGYVQFHGIRQIGFVDGEINRLGAND